MRPRADLLPVLVFAMRKRRAGDVRRPRTSLAPGTPEGTIPEV